MYNAPTTLREKLVEDHREEVVRQLRRKLDAQGQISKKAEGEVIDSLWSPRPSQRLVAVKRWLQAGYSPNQINGWIRNGIPILEVMLAKELPEAGIRPRIGGLEELREEGRRLLKKLLELKSEMPREYTGPSSTDGATIVNRRKLVEAIHAILDWRRENFSRTNDVLVTATTENGSRDYPVLYVDFSGVELSFPAHFKRAESTAPLTTEEIAAKEDIATSYQALLDAQDPIVKQSLSAQMDEAIQRAIAGSFLAVVKDLEMTEDQRTMLPFIEEIMREAGYTLVPDQLQKDNSIRSFYFRASDQTDLFIGDELPTTLSIWVNGEMLVEERTTGMEEISVEQFTANYAPTPAQRAAIPPQASGVQILPIPSAVRVYAQGPGMRGGLEERFRQELPPDVPFSVLEVPFQDPNQQYGRPGVVVKDAGLEDSVANPLNLPTVELWLADLNQVNPADLLTLALRGFQDPSVKLLGVMTFKDNQGRRMLALFV